MKIVSPSLLDIAVSKEDILYSPPDVGHFEGQPETVFLYLLV